MLSSSDQTLHFGQKAIVALNNIAVTMLERGCYKQGFETLKGAVKAAKMISQPIESHDTSTTLHLPSIVNSLRRANHRNALPAISLGQAPLHVVDLTQADLLFSNLNNTRDKEPSHFTYSIIRLDSEAINFGNEDQDLLMAVILSNFTVSCLCRFEKSNKEEISSNGETQDRAIKTLTLSANLLCTIFDSSEDEVITLQVLITSGAVLTTLARVLENRGRSEEAKGCLETASNLEDMARRSFTNQRLISCARGAPAA